MILSIMAPANSLKRTSCGIGSKANIQLPRDLVKQIEAERIKRKAATTAAGRVLDRKGGRFLTHNEKGTAAPRLAALPEILGQRGRAGVLPE